MRLRSPPPAWADAYGEMVARSLLADLDLADAALGETPENRHLLLQQGAELSDRWLLLRELGRGARAIVFEALDLAQVSRLGPDAGALPRRAIKVARTSLAECANPEIHREALLLSRLAGLPGIVSVDGVELVEGCCCLRMAIAPGRPLSAVLGERQPHHPLPEHLGRSVLAELAGCLDGIHGKGIVHGDVKPGNVMVTPTGTVSLVDFGSGREVGGTDDLPVSFTPSWAAPDRTPDTPPKPADDVYALALLCHRLIDGRHPFYRRSASDGGKRDGGALPGLRNGPKKLRLLVDHVLGGGGADAIDFRSALGCQRGACR